MRCPKCHYLSFDPEPRCKNCGYDLEVAAPEPSLRPAAKRAAAPLPDLKLRETPTATALAERYTLVREPDDLVQEEPEIQLRDLDLDETVGPDEPIIGLIDDDDEEPAPPPVAATPVARAPVASTPVAPQPVVSTPVVKPPVVVTPVAPTPVAATPVARTPVAPTTVAPAPAAPQAPAKTAPEQDLLDEDLMIRQFPISRPPLAVRRAAPEAPRVTTRRPTERRPGPLDLDLLEDLRRVEREEADLLKADVHAISSNLSAITEAEERVEPRDRVAAAAIDGAVLGGIAAFVFWATLRLVDVNLFDLPMAALTPLLMFLVMMDVSYLLMFTAAGGQTIGKMVMGIRVVCDEDGPAFVSVRQATWRAVLTVLSLGLAWLPALTGRGLALHDRIAHTRVVRA